ncbi:hypothetical protein [Mammaliicoccus vitulinus]|uniref:hypothetical protein n=1 Tax=Mammaliicoccus vitulinus TaxID=71237 RepID=UPI000E696988|nr:hypothetical protein [Mammaliicoccus vitulinus]QQT16629.1 hypothetical protein I6J10_12465 [Mammaliicoccus vitulinus]QQY20748.1 hypothetical protein I6J11_11950 [Mammaliicoccus vitulinus]RIN16307.1 hypothetical protein BU075_06210 [Mammaliicoccus vitulinus]RIN21367.1 hypothetical protein BU070_10595 [Mammaliicoccus vitulinus]RTX88214.1 hypothetical protein CD108_05470 [Mammaliicoccus vitulinus]
MYKNYNMSQLTLPLDIEVLIPENDIAHFVNQIVETILMRTSPTIVRNLSSDLINLLILSLFSESING